ncbi:MAG: hypothetical protein R3F35_23460 [Myxococcota bacterium]
MRVNAIGKIGICVGALAASFFMGRTSVPSGEVPPTTAGAMERALRSAFEEPDPELRAREMRWLLESIDEETLPGAATAYRDLSATSEAIGVSDFFALWSRIDLDGMIEALSTWPDDRAVAQGMGWAAYRLALTGGADAATAYFESLPNTVRLLTGYRAVEGTLNAGDEEGLVRWLASLADEGERSRLMQAAMFKLIRERGVAGAIGFFDSIPNDGAAGLKRQAFLLLLERLARSDATAAILFQDARTDARWAEDGALRLALAWADVDPRAAIAWIESDVSVEERDRLVEAVVERWAMHDEPAAIDWAREQSQSPLLDRVCARFAGSTIIRAPDESIEIAARIVDDRIRHSALRRFARYWFTRKPEQTGLWLAKAGLSMSEADGMIRALEEDRARRLGGDRSGRG